METVKQNILQLAKYVFVEHLLKNRHNKTIMLSILVLTSTNVSYFNVDKLPLFIVSLVTIAIVLYTTYHKKSRDKYQMRKIGGLGAIEDAIGRATEMARPVLFTPGWGGDIQRPTTIAALNFLSNIAAKTAQYDCQLIFPTHDPVIMTVAQEVIKESYINAGYPDRYKESDICYVSSTQFGYAAAVDGMVSRIKPASIFLLGTFEAESLILAETGNSIGAIQIAGTDSTIQLSFFIVACDFTLIGEELFAASGYLSGDRSIMASVRAQDILKIIIIVFLLVATILVTYQSFFEADLFGWWKF